MRGDNVGDCCEQPLMGGSPPHAWGQTMESKGLHGSAQPVHPHMRGDNFIPCDAHARRSGSPPHAWGQLPAVPSPGAAPRFTPTCVGTMTSNLLMILRL